MSVSVPDTSRLYVDGGWTPPAGTGRIEVLNPSTEEVLGAVPAAAPEDVAAATAAAARALPGWAATPPAERAAVLTAVAGELEKRADEITDLVTAELGMPRKLTSRIQVGLPVGDLRTMAAAAADFPFEEAVGHSLVRRVPAGVVAAITPWNYPLHQIALKVAGALAAGCTLVLKPSEITPLNAFVVAAAIDAAGVPAGVFNLVTGTGPEVGEPLVTAPEVDLVSFTGSPRAGARVAALAGERLKATALELGGKSASVLLPGLDGDVLAKAVKATVTSCYLNSGQTCSALTRLVVPRDLVTEVEEAAVAVAATFTPGDPFDPATRLGPLVSDAQRERVREYVRAGEAGGARLLTGGADAPDGLDAGFFVQPTVFGGAAPDATIVQEEIFGPVLTVQAYGDEDEAVALANGTAYGLAGAVWGPDQEHAEAVGWRLRAGQVDVNGAQYNPAAPFGGFGSSGHGREAGAHGLAEFVTTQSLQR